MSAKSPQPTRTSPSPHVPTPKPGTCPACGDPYDFRTTRDDAHEFHAGRRYRHYHGDHVYFHGIEYSSGAPETGGNR